MKEIIEYIDADGKIPYREWYSKLQKNLKSKITIRLERITQDNYGDTTNEGNGIIAIRFIREGLRIYISNIGNVVVLILCGGDKSSKTQQNKDIQKAKEYLNDFKNR
jgi:putative addiction module killer protein